MAENTMTNYTDLGAALDAHLKYEFEDHDVEATMGTMAAEPYVHIVSLI